MNADDDHNVSIFTPFEFEPKKQRNREKTTKIVLLHIQVHENKFLLHIIINI